MLFLGYGKKRHKNTAHIENEIIVLCTNLAVTNDSLQQIQLFVVGKIMRNAIDAFSTEGLTV